MIIALMGFDGTGKTTTLRLVEEELVRRGLSVVSVPGFEHLILGKFKKLFGAEKRQEQYDGGASGEQSSWFFKLWPLAVFAECWLTFLYFKFLRKEEIIIFDRYFYDWLLSFEKLGYSSRLTRFLFLNCLPRPDLGLVFIAEPEIAYQRKKDDHKDSLSEYGKQLTRYQDLARRKKFSIIDTSRTPPKQLATQVLDLIFGQTPISIGVKNEKRIPKEDTPLASEASVRYLGEIMKVPKMDNTSSADFTTLDKCPLCGGQDISEYKYKVGSISLRGSHSLSFCQNCHHLFTNPKPSSDYLIGLYNEISEGGVILTEERDSFLLKLVKLSYFLSRNFIKFKKGERLLDVGCGNGLYLDFAKARGADVYGNDVDERQLRPIMNKYGQEKIRIGELKDNAWDSEFFDYVTLWHELEHDFDPAITIKEIYRILKQGGWVIIDVPNIDCLERSIFGKYWTMYSLPTHLNHFSPKSLTKLLEKNGFSVAKIRFPAFKPMGFSLSLLFSFSGRFNLCPSPQFIFLWVLFLIPFSFPFILFSSLLKRSPTMIISATKR